MSASTPASPGSPGGSALPASGSDPASAGTAAGADPTGPVLRGALNGIPSYQAGRPAYAGAGQTAHKLSSNENPYPPLASVLAAIRQTAEAAQLYPEFPPARLHAAIADRHGVPVEHVASGTGAVGVLQQLVQSTCGPGDEAVYAWRSFEAYPIVVQISGATSVQVPLRDFRHDLDAMADAVTGRTRAVFVCSPNNPTGTAVRRDELDRFLARVPSDVLVVLDEAYIEFARDPELPDALALYRAHPNVAVLRTFSKAYGLAGMRVGYVIAREPVADAVRKTAVPFGVSQLAQEAAIASLAAEAELFERCDTVVKERDRVVAELRAQGWTVPPAEANFVWLPLGDDTLPFARACGESAIAVRPFPPDGVRVTIGTPEANDAFLSVTAAFRSSARS